MSLIVLLLTFVTSPVLPVWFLLIVLAASAALLWAWLNARKTYQRNLAWQKLVLQLALGAYAEEARVAETQRQAHKETIYALQDQLIELGYVVRGTDKASEQEYRDYCEDHDQEYELPEPLEGATEFALEITFLHKVLSAIHYDLYEERISDPNMEFYQNWVNSLQRQITSWNERRRAIQRLENLKARLKWLEKTLQDAHGVKTRSTSYSSIPVQSHQDLFNLVVVLRELLEMKLASETADLVKEAAQFTLEVEYLERQHEVLDGAITVAYEKTALKLRQVALDAWDDVIAYMFESSPTVLLPYYQESLRKYEGEYTLAVMLLADEGECAQCGAVEHLSTAIKHWGFLRALNIVMYEKCSPNLVKKAHNLFREDVEAKIAHSLQELKQVLDDPSTFEDESACVPELFA